MDLRIIRGLSTDYPCKMAYPWILSEITKCVSAIHYPYRYTDNGYADPNSSHGKGPIIKVGNTIITVTEARGHQCTECDPTADIHPAQS